MLDIIVNPQQEEWAALQSRSSSDDNEIESRVVEIIDAVVSGGDAAIKDLTYQIDKVSLDTLEVTTKEFEEASKNVSEELKSALNRASANIRKFHEAQVMQPIKIETMAGVHCEQRSVAIERVGLYIPGGSAPLFSTVLMLAIPAQVAGCNEIILCTPVGANGKIAPEILYTAQLCGVDKIYKVGGAQAIAAMAYGSESIKRVDKIFGPGNRYVTKAKQIVSQNSVAIDMPAGPSEVMIIADDSAVAKYVAADMLSQAEHGADSQSILVTTSLELAKDTAKELELQLVKLNRSSIANKALNKSRIIVLDSREAVIEFANSYASEHLIISMTDSYGVANQIKAAGSIFLGNYTPESAGDYASGTNHTLPTSGWARSFSGVNIDSFVRKVTIQELTLEGLSTLSETITTMAYAEGLDAHAEAVNIRIEDLKTN